MMIGLAWGATVWAQPATTQSTEPRVIGYYAGWSARTYPIADIPATKLTHVNYAFAVIQDGQCAVKNETEAAEHFRQFAALKQKHPHLKVLISVGGWTDSGPFSDAALTAESRETFAKSACAFASKHKLDGIDIDWEYPGGGGMEKDKGRPEDKRNFTLLLAELRRRLDDQGQADKKRYLLTMAAPASPSHYRNIELDQICQHLDWINLMTYDMAGEWSKVTSFNAPLYSAPNISLSADESVRGYLEAGVPNDKLVLGVPFYGRAFGGVKNIDNGLFQPHERGARAKLPGGGSYRNLAARHIDKTAKRFWHEQAKVPWLFDEESGLFVTYDDPQSLKLKAEYTRQHKLGGVMIWELSDDDEKHSLLDALNEGLQR